MKVLLSNFHFRNDHTSGFCVHRKDGITFHVLRFTLKQHCEVSTQLKSKCWSVVHVSTAFLILSDFKIFFYNSRDIHTNYILTILILLDLHPHHMHYYKPNKGNKWNNLKHDVPCKDFTQGDILLTFKLQFV